MKRTYKPKLLIVKRRQGFLKRLRAHIQVLQRRKQKGRHVL